MAQISHFGVIIPFTVLTKRIVQSTFTLVYHQIVTGVRS